MRLNHLCDEVKQYLINGELTQGHARALLSLENKDQIAIAEKIINDGLNVRQTEALVSGVSLPKKSGSKKPLSPMLQKYFKDVEDTLSSRFGTKVKILEGNKKGKIEIEYYSKDDLERILFELRQ